jgi:hypothetical protein
VELLGVFEIWDFGGLVSNEMRNEKNEFLD